MAIRAISALALTAALFVAGCGDSTGVPRTLVGSVNTQGLVLNNRTATAVGFVAVGDAVVPVIEWLPCTCPKIGPGAQFTVPRDQITGLAESGGAVTVFWWAVRPVSGGGYEYVPGVGGQLRVRGL